MVSITIRNVPDEVHRALKVQAAQHGRSTEAEIRHILESVARPEGRVNLGALLANIGRELELTDEECDIFDQVRDRTPSEPLEFD